MGTPAPAPATLQPGPGRRRGDAGAAQLVQGSAETRAAAWAMQAVPLVVLAPVPVEGGS